MSIFPKCFEVIRITPLILVCLCVLVAVCVALCVCVCVREWVRKVLCVKVFIYD
jgi:hypothetical protein